MSGGRFIGNPNPSLGGLPPPPNMDAHGAVMMGYGGQPEVGARKLIGVRVTDAGAVVVDVVNGGFPTGVDTIDLAGREWDEEIPNANGPNTLSVSAFLWGVDANTGAFRQVPLGSNGEIAVLPIGNFQITDNIDLSTGFFAPGIAASFHRNQTGNGYWSRGGYNGAIPAAAIPALPNSLATAAYNFTAPTVSSGGACALQADGRGQLLTLAAAPAPGSARACASFTGTNGLGTLNVKAAPGNLLAIDVSSSDAAELWIQVWDLAGTPAGGTVIGTNFVKRLGPDEEWTVGRDFFGEAGRAMANGIQVTISSSRGTYTAVAVPDVTVNVSYV